MASARKYMTVEQLTEDALYWEEQEADCRHRSLNARTQAVHDFYYGKQCAAREKAKASRQEIKNRETR